jgi:hypothetical protein
MGVAAAARFPLEGQGSRGVMATLLWIIAVILVISGIYVLLARRDILWGIVLIVIGLLVGPGGVSIFNV